MGFRVEAVGCVHFGSRCERSVGFIGHLQEMALAVSRTTDSPEVYSAYLARPVLLTGELIWP